MWMKLLTYKSFFKFSLIVIFLGAFSACGPSSSQDYQMQAQVSMKKLVKELNQAKDYQTLKLRERKIKKEFDSLIQTLIQYQAYIDRHPEVSSEPVESLQKVASDLDHELQRVYCIQGGRDIIIETQQEAYLKLSLSEHIGKVRTL